jgi:hypothetical protein
MATQKKNTNSGSGKKAQVKLQDMKPSKDAKGGRGGGRGNVRGATRPGPGLQQN